MPWNLIGEVGETQTETESITTLRCGSHMAHAEAVQKNDCCSFTG